MLTEEMIKAIKEINLENVIMNIVKNHNYSLANDESRHLIMSIVRPRIVEICQKEIDRILSNAESLQYEIEVMIKNRIAKGLMMKIIKRLFKEKDLYNLIARVTAEMADSFKEDKRTNCVDEIIES